MDSKNANEKQNARQMPKMFYARHMKDGICGYDEEVLLVDTDAIKKMMPSFVGKPLYVMHVDEVNMATLKEDAHGYVLDTFYNEMDGWVWSKFLAVDDIAFDAIAKNWAVSNAYVPTETAAGGTKHNCPYDREVINAEYTHLAIVPNPRYEDACIMTPEEFKAYQEGKQKNLNELQNSKDTKQKGKRIMKLFKRTKVETDQIDNDTLVEIQNDDGTTSEVSIADMVGAVTNEKKMNKDYDMMVNVDGDEMSVKELMNRYKKMNKKNRMDGDKEKMNKDYDDKEKMNRDYDDMERMNEEDDEKSNEDDKDEMDMMNKKKGKKNSKDHYGDLQAAHLKNSKGVPIDTGLDQVNRGQARYGSGN